MYRDCEAKIEMRHSGTGLLNTIKATVTSALTNNIIFYIHRISRPLAASESASVVVVVAVVLLLLFHTRKHVTHGGAALEIIGDVCIHHPSKHISYR